MFSKRIGIDLGTANVLVFESSRGIILDEPAVVALTERDGNVVAVGDDAKLMIGARVNETRTIRDHFWYGYIDEISLWNTFLADSTIKFQYKHPDKLGDYYLDPYHNSLIGLWRFNLTEPQLIAEDDSKYANNGIIYTLNGFRIELSQKGIQ